MPYSFNIGLDPDQLPSFTSSVTLSRPEKEPLWLKAHEIVAMLKEKGISVTTPTLFNMEKRGTLHPRRMTAKKILFDWNEVQTQFKVN